MTEATPAPPAPQPPPSAASPVKPRSWPLSLAGLALLIAVLALGWAAWSGQRLGKVERILVKRQDDGAQQITEARLLAKQAEEGARQALAKATLLEARLAEVGVQREQIDELMRSMVRSREDQLLGEAEAALRAALQMSAITGSAEPLVAALQGSKERLSGGSLRLEPVRIAMERDLDQLRNAPLADLSTLARRLDEAVALVDNLPLIQDLVQRETAQTPAPERRPPPAGEAGSAGAWLGWFAGRIGEELRSLVRIREIDRPEAILLNPEQAFLLRENLKLKLLNARLAVMSRQFDTAQVDLQACQAALARYFDSSHRRHAQLAELLQGVARQAQPSALPRPDDSLAALTAAAGVR